MPEAAFNLSGFRYIRPGPRGRGTGMKVLGASLFFRFSGQYCVFSIRKKLQWSYSKL